MFTPIYNELFGHYLRTEGGDADIKGDPGGRTRYGITEKTAKALGYDVTRLTLDDAKAIVWDEFWRRPNFDQVYDATGSKAIAWELLKNSTWLGPGRTAMWFQEALNHLNDLPIQVDGIIGSRTMASLHSVIARHGREHSIAHFMLYRTGAHIFQRLVEADYVEPILPGWLANRMWNPYLAHPVGTTPGDAPQLLAPELPDIPTPTIREDTSDMGKKDKGYFGDGKFQWGDLVSPRLLAIVVTIIGAALGSDQAGEWVDRMREDPDQPYMEQTDFAIDLVKAIRDLDGDQLENNTERLDALYEFINDQIAKSQQQPMTEPIPERREVE